MKDNLLKGTVRLAPAAISLFATLLLIHILGRESYGQLSVAIAIVNLLNAIFFHSFRNLIIYHSKLNISLDEVGTTWGWGVLLALICVFVLVAAGYLKWVLAALVFVFIIGQSLFERELEFRRSLVDIKNYLLISCMRPLWTIVGIAIFFYVGNGDSDKVLLALTIVAISPFIAMLPAYKEMFRHTKLGLMSPQGAIKTMFTGALITAPLSFLFISDALIKNILAVTHFPAHLLGEYAAINDVVMPVCWVLASTVGWFYAPAIVRADHQNRRDIAANYSKKIFLMVAVMILIVVGVLLSDKGVDFPRIAMGVLLVITGVSAALFALFVVPTLIAEQKISIATLLGLLGLTGISAIVWTLSSPISRGNVSILWLVAAVALVNMTTLVAGTAIGAALREKAHLKDV